MIGFIFISSAQHLMRYHWKHPLHHHHRQLCDVCWEWETSVIQSGSQQQRCRQSSSRPAERVLSTELTDADISTTQDRLVYTNKWEMRYTERSAILALYEKMYKIFLFQITEMIVQNVNKKTWTLKLIQQWMLRIETTENDLKYISSAAKGKV